MVAAGMVLATWIGLALVGILGGLPRRSGPHRWLLAGALAAPLGVAMTSATAFVWLVALRPVLPWPGYVTVELALAGGLTAFWLWRRWARTIEAPPTVLPASRATWLLTGLGAISSGALLIHLVRAWLIASFRSPLGDWDAWAIWNLRARFLLSPESWRHGFSPEIAWSHPDYPLLLPSSVARGYCWSGEPTWAAPALLTLMFLLAGPALAALVVYRLRGTVAALVTGVLSLGIAYWSLAFYQYADLPLACFFLAVNALLLLARWHPGSDWMWPLAGLLAGALVWTKNEGWVMLAALVVSELLAACWTPRALRPAPRQVACFGLGLLPLLAVTIGFKLALAPANDLSASAQWAHLLDPARLALIGKHLGTLLVTPGPFHLPLIPLLGGYLMLQGTASPATARPALGALALRMGLVLAAYGAVYLVTPYSLQWHLETSAQRLLTQVLPSLVLLVLALARSPLETGTPDEPAITR